MDETKPCPFCRSPIDAAARKCPICGEYTEAPRPEIWRLELINLQILFAVLEAKIEALFNVLKELEETKVISVDFKSLQDFVRNATYQNITEFFENETPEVLYEFSKALTTEWARRSLEKGETLDSLSHSSWSYLKSVLESLGVDAEIFKEWARRRNIDPNQPLKGPKT